MSWLWGSSGSDEEKDSGPKELPKEEVTYGNVFIPDSHSSSSIDPSSLGSAFSDQSDFTDTPTDNFLADDSGSFNASAYPAGGPRVDFDRIGTINPATMGPAFGIYNMPSNAGVDYVFSDDYKEMRKKHMTEQLVYLCGFAYLSGVGIGGSMGVLEGARASIGKSAKLRLNAVLNASVRKGVAASNAAAVLALLFSLSESAVYHYANDDTAINYAAAGAVTGALYKSTRGIRVAGMWAAAGAALSLATVYATRNGSYGKGLQGIL